MQDIMPSTVPADDTEMSPDQSGDMSAVSVDPADTADQTTSDAESTETAVDDGERMLPADTPTYMPRYNGTVYPVRADATEEITTLLQLGMKQRDFLPHYERLARLASDRGDASVRALIDRLCDEAEKEHFVKAVETYGKENGVRFYELERADRQRKYEQLVQDNEQRQQQAAMTDAERIASQFVQLQQSHPEYTQINQLPKEVLQSALTEQISLLDAHNRFVLDEQRRREQTAAAENEARRLTTGSLAQNGDAPVSAVDAFVSGLHSRT